MRFKALIMWFPVWFYLLAFLCTMEDSISADSVRDKGRTIIEEDEDGYPPHCDDTSNCDRDRCSDKRAYAPVECHGHVDQMDCFKACRDPAGLAKCFEERESNNTAEYCLLKYKRSILWNGNSTKYSEHLGIPCKLKCLVDAKFWSCVHSCDAKGCFESFRRCEREPGEDGGDPECREMTDATFRNWGEKNCYECYIKNLIDEIEVHPDCMLRYSLAGDFGDSDDPELMLSVVDKLSRCVYKEDTTSESKPAMEKTHVYEAITDCVSKLSSDSENNAKDVGVLEKCYREKLMLLQYEACKSGDGTFVPQCAGELVNTAPCHSRCTQLLTKPYCHINCPRNIGLQACSDKCKKKWPVPQCVCTERGEGRTDYYLNENDQRTKDYTISTTQCSTHDCYASNIHSSRLRGASQTNGADNVNIGQEADDDESDDSAEATQLRNCKSERHIQHFANKFVDIYNEYLTVIGSPTTNSTLGSDIGRLANHYTYFECMDMEEECKGVPENDMSHCISVCLTTQRSNEEMNKVCEESGNNTNANFLRSEILMYCMLMIGSSDTPDKVETARNWTFKMYANAPRDDYNTYHDMVDCERESRQMDESTVPSGVFLIFANITYQLEAIWCEECILSNTNGTFHPYDLDRARCVLDECYKVDPIEACPKLRSTQIVIQTILSTQCGWNVDYSLSRQPYKIWRTYFDEFPPHEVSKHLEEPNTEKYLLKSNISSTEGHYSFPYFIVFRGICENGYYDDNVYKFIASGLTPVIKLSYVPITARQKQVNLLVSVFQSALVNLERHDKEEILYIPPNPMNRKNETTNEYDGRAGCHLNLCYPAFVVPQTLLQIPSFEITVLNQQSFSSLSLTGYTSTFHARDVSGIGSLKVTDRRDPPTANQFFPEHKVQVYEDTQFAELWKRIPDSGYVQNATSAPAGPDLAHMTDVNCKRYQPQHTLSLGGNENLPLDSEDFIRFQYTHGSAPQVILAGFYDPNLVIVAQPNLNAFHLTRWNFESTSGTPEDPTARLFHGRYSCITPQYKVGGYSKPMYSMYDRSDKDYWLQFYRMRYAIKNYENPAEAKAIFDAITLEDRVLFVTTGGIVSLYQNSNVTSSLGKAWEVEGADSLERCFKIFRSSRSSHPQGDTIVGITYDYQVIDDHDGVIKDVNQQVWVGRYTQAGVPIRWTEIKSGGSSNILKEERVFNIGGDSTGTMEALPDQKVMEIPVERRETSPKSQIEAICYKAYRSNMAKASYIELMEDDGWCNAVDATPITAVGSDIQLLVRMRTYYNGGEEMSAGDGNVLEEVIFYVIASFAFEKSETQSTNWQIDSIIPRVPCLDDHDESIPSVVPFTMEYFRQEDLANSERLLGCHNIDKYKKEENLIYLHGMTYTRNFNRYLFLYGNKLLQSTDGGQTFVQLKSFPKRGKIYPHTYECKGTSAAYHRIMLMAFDDLGHYAFLTSKRELWYGNLGSLEQIRLRPSDAHSMVSTYIPELKEITDAVPFSLTFDTKDELIELVAVVNTNGSVIRIAKRPANEKAILRASFFLKKAAEKSEELQDMLRKEFAQTFGGNPSPDADPNSSFSERLLKHIHYNPVEWSVFCPYASPAFRHNFSEKHARAQNFFLPSPRQHLKLGMDHTVTSLLTFQAVAFSLVWKSFFQESHSDYSNLEEEPIKTWINKKSDIATIGRLTYLNNDYNENGILVFPNKYQRTDPGHLDAKRIFKLFYLDYGVTIFLKIEFSVSNDFTFNPVDYQHHHLSAIHLNVDNANGSLININTEREMMSFKAAVRYVVHIRVNKNSGLPQVLSGRNGIQVPIFFHLIGGFGNCVPLESAGILGDSIATAISVGCPPSTDLVFDWESSLKSINFRDESAHYGNVSSECYNGERFCFYVKKPLILHFHLFDESKQNYFNFSGKYIMRIIGGGYSRETMQTYTPEQQDAFNVPGVSDVSLIWNEWDRENHRKVERREEVKDGSNRNDSREIILRAGVSSIQWACHTLSPCARITPRRSMESIYYFKVFISNRGVDNDTLCLFEKEFLILLYGFPPSTEIQLITTILFYILILTLVYLAYICLRENKKMWKATKSKLYGWYQIVIDTLPKKWTKDDYEEVVETEEEKQKRRDDIILSLQGHLNVPRIIHKPSGEQADESVTSKGEGEIGFEFSNAASHRPSSTSMLSSASGGSNALVLNPVVGRPAAATWTDLIYEQMISRRLAHIVERNRQNAEMLKRKSAMEKQEK